MEEIERWMVCWGITVIPWDLIRRAGEAADRAIDLRAVKDMTGCVLWVYVVER